MHLCKRIFRRGFIVGLSIKNFSAGVSHAVKAGNGFIVQPGIRGISISLKMTFKLIEYFLRSFTIAPGLVVIIDQWCLSCFIRPEKPLMGIFLFCLVQYCNTGFISMPVIITQHFAQQRSSQWLYGFSHQSYPIGNSTIRYL